MREARATIVKLELPDLNLVLGMFQNGYIQLYSLAMRR